jgi:type IV pilus assembly protein PilM
MASGTQSGRPRLACEVTAERVIAARAGPNGTLESVAARGLDRGVVQPRLAAENIASSTTVTRAIEEAFALCGARGRDVTVVLPDAAVRLMILDFDSLPEREADATPLVRFRLKKLLPFDADRAALSYQALRDAAGVRVVAAVGLGSVVEEYEAPFRNLGFNPGVVLPSLAAALGAVDAATPTLVVKADAATTAVAIVDNDQLRLVRTLEYENGALRPQQLADDIHPLLVFFEDTYGSPIGRVLVGGNLAAETLRPVLEPLTQARIEDLASSAQLSAAATGNVPRGAMAGVAGALLG